jgi:hypothetical protein
MTRADGRRIHTDAQWTEGSPLDVACTVSRTVITPVAKQVKDAVGDEGVVEYFTALSTHMVASMAIILGPAIARAIVQVAMDQIDEAAAGAAALARTGAH